MSINSIKYYLVFILIIITSFQYSSWGISGEMYTILRGIIITLTIIIFFVSLKGITYKSLKSKIFKTHFIGLALLVSILVALYIFGFSIINTPVRDLALALIILIIGLNLNLEEKLYKRLINIYIVLYTLAALSIVFTYASGFVIKEQYLPIPKNQLAPAFGVAFILSFYFSFKKKRLTKLFYYAFTGLLFASLLVIRGRAVLVAVFLTIIIFIFYYIKSRKYKIATIIVGIALIPFIGQFIYEALILNYDVSNINSVSTGRWATYMEGLNFFKLHWIGGLIESSSYNGDTIHNYILYNLVNYGVFIGSLLLIIYFKYILKIASSIRNNTFLYFEVGPLVMVIIFIVSLFEYAYPFAPGSAIFFPFFLMGQYLQKETTL